MQLHQANSTAFPSRPVQRFAERQEKWDMTAVHGGTQHIFVQLIAQITLQVL